MKRVNVLTLILAIIISPIIGALSNRSFEARREKLIKECTSNFGKETFQLQGSNVFLTQNEEHCVKQTQPRDLSYLRNCENNKWLFESPKYVIASKERVKQYNVSLDF
jgi:hypothetical protein